MTVYYTKEVKEFAKVRMEQTPNNTQIARDIRNKFDLDKELDVIRRTVSDWRTKLEIQAKKLPIKRLFFDIETSYIIYRRWKFGPDKYVNPSMIIEDSKIICICYKWQYEDKIKSIDWRSGEKKMLKEFVKIMGEADECVFHNGDRFDIKELRTRCIYHGVLMFPNYRTLDTLKKSKGFFNFSSNKLDYIGKFLNIGGKRADMRLEDWINVIEDNNKGIDKMISYCERDVALLEDVFFVMSPFIDHNNNFAVLTGGKKWDCPHCTSKNVEMFRTYSTPLGIIRREMKCGECKKQYRISNKNYMGFLEYQAKKDNQ